MSVVKKVTFGQNVMAYRKPRSSAGAKVNRMWTNGADDEGAVPGGDDASAVGKGHEALPMRSASS
jgi:hypothetical protein